MHGDLDPAALASQALERLEQEPANTRRQGTFEDALAMVRSTRRGARVGRR
jgi:hypothetical protein